MTARIVASARVGGLSWLWRAPAAGALIAFYLLCLTLDAIQTTWRRLAGRAHHGR